MNVIAVPIPWIKSMKERLVQVDTEGTVVDWKRCCFTLIDAVEQGKVRYNTKLVEIALEYLTKHSCCLTSSSKLSTSPCPCDALKVIGAHHQDTQDLETMAKYRQVQDELLQCKTLLEEFDIERKKYVHENEVLKEKRKSQELLVISLRKELQYARVGNDRLEKKLKKNQGRYTNLATKLQAEQERVLEYEHMMKEVRGHNNQLIKQLEAAQKEEMLLRNQGLEYESANNVLEQTLSDLKKKLQGVEPPDINTEVAHTTLIVGAWHMAREDKKRLTYYVKRGEVGEEAEFFEWDVYPLLQMAVYSRQLKRAVHLSTAAVLYWVLNGYRRMGYQGSIRGLPVHKLTDWLYQARKMMGGDERQELYVEQFVEDHDLRRSRSVSSRTWQLERVVERVAVEQDVLKETVSCCSQQEDEVQGCKPEMLLNAQPMVTVPPNRLCAPADRVAVGCQKCRSLGRRWGNHQDSECRGRKRSKSRVRLPEML